MKKFLMTTATVALFALSVPAHANEQCTTPDEAAKMTETDATANQDASAQASASQETETAGTSAEADASVNAQASADAETPDKVVDEIVENAKEAEDGTKVASTGPAKPVENWFGCPPEGKATTG